MTNATHRDGSDEPTSELAARVQLAELLVWDLVATRGPEATLLGLIDSTLTDRPLPPGALKDERMRDLHEQLASLRRDGVDVEEALRELTGSFELASLVWQAYFDGFQAGVESASGAGEGQLVTELRPPGMLRRRF